MSQLEMLQTKLISNFNFIYNSDCDHMIVMTLILKTRGNEMKELMREKGLKKLSDNICEN